ncbi:MAG: CPBP family intramembrane glutamic endopeptidase [Promethearchaeota archaeon]
MILKDLKFGIKYITITFVVTLLIIPLFFGIYIDFLFVSEFSLCVILFLLIGFLFLVGLGKLIEILMYNDKSKEMMKQHDVIKALLNGNDIIVLLVFFPLTMIMEEFIFRYYLVGILLHQLKLEIILAFLISSAIFSLYHLHIWFKFKNLKILVSYLISSFLLAIYNGYLLITLGIFACIIVHTSLVFILYYNLYKKLS